MELNSQSFFEVFYYLIHSGSGVNIYENAFFPVEVDKGRCLGAVHFKAFLDGFVFIIIADINFAAAMIADPVFFGLVKNRVKIITAFTANPAAAKTLQNAGVGNIKIYDFINSGKLRQSFSLRYGSGEPVEDIALLRIFLGKPFLYKVDGSLVINELSCVHDGFNL